MVELAGVSLASCYRVDDNAEAEVDPDMDLPNAIRPIVLDWPTYRPAGDRT